MTITLHWWTVPLTLACVGVLLILNTESEGSYFPMPSWHLAAGGLALFAAACIAVGHWL